MDGSNFPPDPGQYGSLGRLGLAAGHSIRRQLSAGLSPGSGHPNSLSHFYPYLDWSSGGDCGGDIRAHLDPQYYTDTHGNTYSHRDTHSQPDPFPGNQYPGNLDSHPNPNPNL